MEGTGEGVWILMLQKLPYLSTTILSTTTVRATFRKQETPQLWMEGTGEGVWILMLQKLPYLSTTIFLNNFVANWSPPYQAHGY